MKGPARVQQRVSSFVRAGIVALALGAGMAAAPGVAAHTTDVCAQYPPDDMSVWNCSARLYLASRCAYSDCVEGGDFSKSTTIGAISTLEHEHQTGLNSSSCAGFCDGQGEGSGRWRTRCGHQNHLPISAAIDGVMKARITSVSNSRPNPMVVPT